MTSMTSLQVRLEELAEEFRLVSDVIHHYKRVETEAPFGVWAEQYEENSNYADNQKTEFGIHIQLDYYTKTEFDPVIDAIQNYMTGKGYAWNLDSVLFEDETNLIHYTWGLTLYGKVDDQGA